jgi:hypothetical protein
MIVWKSILNENGMVIAPYNTILALKVGWNDEELGDLFKIYPVEIVLNYECNEPGGRTFSYPVVESVDFDTAQDIQPEDLGCQHTWCLWEEFIKEMKL